MRTYRRVSDKQNAGRKKAHLERPRQSLERLVETLPRQHLLLARFARQIPRFSHHPLPMTLHIEQRVQKLPFSRRGLMDPRQHVTDVPCGIMRV